MIELNFLRLLLALPRDAWNIFSKHIHYCHYWEYYNKYYRTYNTNNKQDRLGSFKLAYYFHFAIEFLKIIFARYTPINNSSVVQIPILFGDIVHWLKVTKHLSHII